MFNALILVNCVQVHQLHVLDVQKEHIYHHKNVHSVHILVLIVRIQIHFVQIVHLDIIWMCQLVNHVKIHVHHVN